MFERNKTIKNISALILLIVAREYFLRLADEIEVRNT
jgi:hypothetical protein